MEDDDLVGSVGLESTSRAPSKVSPTKRRRHGGGRPAYKPRKKDRHSVIAWVAGGIPQEVIAELLRISLPTLRKHFRFELDHGSSQANAMVLNGLFTKAMKGDTASLIFWTKARLGWRDQRQYDAENPLVVKGDAPQVDPHALARELRAALLEMKTIEGAVAQLPAP